MKTCTCHEEPGVQGTVNEIRVTIAREITNALPPNTPLETSMANYTITHAEFMKVLKTKITETDSAPDGSWEGCAIHNVKVPNLQNFTLRLSKLRQYQEKVFIPAMARACSNVLWSERGEALKRLHSITRIWTEGLENPSSEAHISPRTASTEELSSNSTQTSTA